MRRQSLFELSTQDPQLSDSLLRRFASLMFEFLLERHSCTQLQNRAPEPHV